MWRPDLGMHSIGFDLFLDILPLLAIICFTWNSYIKDSQMRGSILNLCYIKHTLLHCQMCVHILSKYFSPWYMGFRLSRHINSIAGAAALTTEKSICNFLHESAIQVCVSWSIKSSRNMIIIKNNACQNQPSLTTWSGERDLYEDIIKALKYVQCKLPVLVNNIKRPSLHGRKSNVFELPHQVC